MLSSAIRRGVSAALAPMLSVAGVLGMPSSAHAADASAVDDLEHTWQMPETVVDPTTTQVHVALVALRHDVVRRPGAVYADRAAEAHTRPDPHAIEIVPRTLSSAMGGTMTLARYRELTPAFNDALADAHCDTLRRAAMFIAQVGHESLGLRYMEEIASGSAYDGRVDLGNTHPGDGHRFKGRGPIQVTGRTNYDSVSEWAHDRGIVPTDDYFLDHPARLASDRFGFVGVVWYWTCARHMNAFADRRDVVGATVAVNGGTNGLHDRIARWHHVLRIGNALLAPGGYRG